MFSVFFCFFVFVFFRNKERYLIFLSRFLRFMTPAAMSRSGGSSEWRSVESVGSNLLELAPKFTDASKKAKGIGSG